MGDFEDLCKKTKPAVGILHVKVHRCQNWRTDHQLLSKIYPISCMNIMAKSSSQNVVWRYVDNSFLYLCIITLRNNKPISNQQRLRWFLYCGFTQLPALQPLPTPHRPRSETQIIKNEFSTKFLHLPSDPHSSHSAGTSKARQYEIFPILIRVPHFIFDKCRNWGGGGSGASFVEKKT